MVGGLAGRINQASRRITPNRRSSSSGGAYAVPNVQVRNDGSVQAPNRVAYAAAFKDYPNVHPWTVKAAVDTALGSQGQQSNPAPRNPSPGGGSSGGGRRGGGRRGGGGGGGGGGAAAAAQKQMDFLTQLLNSGAYKVNPATYDAMNATISGATAKDQAAATGAYNNLDTYLQGHQTNPYANVHMQRASTAPSYNPYLQSQGIAGSAPVAANPDDSYGAFQNVLSLLGANQQANNASGLRQSQEARTYAGQQIGAVDNAYLANVAAQRGAAQQALDTEKRQGLAQLAALIAQGAKAPNLAALGV